MEPEAGARKSYKTYCKILTAGLLLIFLTQPGAAQSFAVRNPKNLKWPQAEAEKLYKLASRMVEDEFKPRQAVRPQFTLVLGYEKDQMDVNSNELRLSQWDRRLFTEGVILFSFEQMLPAPTKTRMVQRVLKESDSVLSVDEARQTAPCTPGVLGTNCTDSKSPKR